MGLGIGIGDLELGYWIRIGDWDWGLDIGTGDWVLEIWDWDWRLRLGIGTGDWILEIGDWDWRFGIGRMTNDNDYILHFVLMRMKFIQFLHFMLELLLCFFEGYVVAGLMKN